MQYFGLKQYDPYGVRCGAGELVPIKAIHYKGVAQGQIDLVAGRVQLSAGTLFSGLPQIKQGRLRVGATLNTERSTQLTDLRTSHEQGFNIDFPSWIGLFAPPGTRREIIGRLNMEFVRAVRSPDVLKALDAQGSLPIASSPEDFRKKISGELAYWKRIIQENDITLEEEATAVQRFPVGMDQPIFSSDDR